MPTRAKKELSPLERFREVFSEIAAPKEGLPTMQTRISDISSDELGNMIARYSAWREFTEDRHAEACAVFSQLKSEYDLAHDQMVLQMKGSNITEKKLRARASNEVAEIGKKLAEAEMFRDLLAGKLDSFSNVLAMLSRELTRRGVNNL